MKIETIQNNSPVFQERSVSLDLPFASAKENTVKDAVRVNDEVFAPGQAREKLFQAVEAADERMQDLGLHIRLRVGENSERLQVEIYDPETKEVIRRLPPDEIIKLAESLEEMAGVILDRSL